MDKVKSAKLKTLLTSILALIVVITIAFAAACAANTSQGDSSSDSSADSSGSSSSSTATERTDYQTISNGDFEYKHDSATLYPVTKSFDWTRTNDSINTSAVSSSQDSGIIKVTEGEQFQEFAKNKGFPTETVDGTTRYVNPSTPEQKGYVSVANKDLYVYDENEKNEDKLPTSGNHVLMINNSTSGKTGTAQKFTSTSTVTVKGYGKLTVWVLTLNLSSKMENVEYGAYIMLSNTLGSASSSLIAKNIDTDGKWQKFEFYLSASDYSTTTFKVVLGLGFGSKEYQAEYVEGIALFDNVNYTEITESAYQAAANHAATKNLNAYQETEPVETYSYDGVNNISNAFDLNVAAYTKSEDLKISQKDITEKTEGSGENAYSVYTLAFSSKISTAPISLADKHTESTNNEIYAKPVAYTMETKLGVGNFNDIVSEKISGVENPLGNVETAYLIHENGASSKMIVSDDNGFIVYDNTAVYITFLMKVKTGTAQNGVTVKVIDKGSVKTASETATSVLSNVKTNSVEDENLKDFVRVNIFITNFKGDKFERKFAIEIDFGPTDTVWEQIKLTEGYALITGVETTVISESEYNSASKTGAYDGSVSLGAEIKNAAEDEDDSDVYAINYAKSGEGEIENNVVTSVYGFKGVVGNSKAVGGTLTDYDSDKTVAGVINNKYADNYSQLALIAPDIKSLTAEDGNNNAQALVIYNTQAASYGFIADSKTLSANSSTLISVKLRVFGNAKAYVYLAATDPLKNFEILTIEGKAVNRDGKKPVYSTTAKTAEVYKQLYQTVTEKDCKNGETADWVTVNFLLKAGDKDIEYRVEIFNGSRDGDEQTAGLIAIASLEYQSGVDIDDYKNEIVAKYGKSDNDETCSYKGVVKAVTYTDSDGFNNVKYTNDPYPVDVYTYLDNAKTVIATYENIDVETEIDESTPITEENSSSETEEDEEKAENYSLPLQITSIVISVVLIIALLVLVFRALFKKLKNDKEEVKNLYNRNSREKVQDQINSNKAKREAAAIKKANEAVATPAENAESADTENSDSAEQPIESADESVEPDAPSVEDDKTE